jgi:hypothetical protein
MPDVSIRLPAADYGEAYERMRACVKAESAHGPRYVAGLGLVLQEGVAGWLSAHARVCSATADATAIQQALQADKTEQVRSGTRVGSVANAVPTEILPLAHQPDLTLLIACMVVSAQRDVLCARP